VDVLKTFPYKTWLIGTKIIAENHRHQIWNIFEEIYGTVCCGCKKEKKSIGAHYFTHTLMMMFCSEWMPNIGTICIYMCLLGKEFCNFSTKGNDFFICNLFLFVLFGKKTWGIVTIFSFFFLCYKSFTKGRLNFLGYCSELQIVLQQVDFCFSVFSWRYCLFQKNKFWAIMFFFLISLEKWNGAKNCIKVVFCLVWHLVWMKRQQNHVPQKMWCCLRGRAAMKIGPKIVQTKTLQFQPKNSGNIKVGAQKRNVYVEPKSKNKENVLIFIY